MLAFVKNKKIRTLLLVFSLTLLLAGLVSLGNTQSVSSSAAMDELLQMSQKEKKGLTFYLNGQTIPGIVTAAGENFVEVRNQTHSRIVIRLDRVDGVAIQ